MLYALYGIFSNSQINQLMNQDSVSLLLPDGSQGEVKQLMLRLPKTRFQQFGRNHSCRIENLIVE
jgi:hypothetical protein